MALAPHWLDDVIGEERDPKAIAQAIGGSPKLLHIIKVGVDQAILNEDQNEGRLIAGPGFNQTIREAVVKGIESPTASVPQGD